MKFDLCLNFVFTVLNIVYSVLCTCSLHCVMCSNAVSARYGMPSNAESKPDMMTEEAEKCALLVKSSKNRKKSKDEKQKV